MSLNVVEKKKVKWDERTGTIVKMVNVSDCVPMKELFRRYYDPSNYAYLKRTIESDGYDKVYPIRGIWNKELGKFEIFDGIHRLKVLTRLRNNSKSSVTELYELPHPKSSYS